LDPERVSGWERGWEVKQKYMQCEGKRVLSVWGNLGRCTEVKPHGKTSARFIVVYDGSGCAHAYTPGEFEGKLQIVAEDFAHHFPPVNERLRGLMRVVDQELGGRIPYSPGNFTEVRNRVIDTVTGKIGVDRMTQASPFGTADWSLMIHLHGEPEAIEIKATPEDMKASGGYTWPAFRKHLEKMVGEPTPDEKTAPDLAKCPFCGSDHLEIIRRVDGNHKDVVYTMVMCHGCLMEGPLGIDEAQAVKQWNKRVAAKATEVPA
jgi:Lar family restriction alleviation protein